jgi:hypothetical protein
MHFRSLSTLAIHRLGSTGLHPTRLGNPYRSELVHR